jgi:hypothetical protein
MPERFQEYQTKKAPRTRGGARGARERTHGEGYPFRDHSRGERDLRQTLHPSRAI